MANDTMTAKADIATATNAGEKNTAEKVSIKNATETTLFKNVLEFSQLSAIHTAFIEKVGNQKLGELKGQTTIGNVFCLSSGYVGNQLGTSPSFEKVIKVYADLFAKKHEDTDAEKSAKALKRMGVSYSALPDVVKAEISEDTYKAY